MQGTRRFATAVACAVAASIGGAAPAAAAPPTPDTPVARVAGATIDLATVDRWRGWGDRPRQGPAARRRALTLLLGVRAALSEAKRVGIAVPPRPRLPRDLEFEPSARGANGADVLLWRRGVAAALALEQRAIDALGPITRAQLERVWRTQRGPEWFTARAVHAEVVILGTRARADLALDALRAGEPFSTVAERLGPPSSVGFDGQPLLLTDHVVPDGSAAGLRVLQVVMESAPGALTGPFEVDGGFAITRVTEVVAEPRRIPFAQVRPRLLDEVRFRRSERVLPRLERRMLARGRAQTTCARFVAVRRVCGRVVDRL